jgi:hypothetical protein
MESEGNKGTGECSKVWFWWTSLKVIAVFNVLLWLTTCLPRAGEGTWQVALSGVYVAVCAFRSWRPRVDVERYCLVDSPWSSPFVGRCVATVAEVCFAIQVALAVHQVGLIANVPWISAASVAIVPPLVLAQAFCWYSVISLDHLGHVVEESLWAATMALVGVCLTAAARHLGGHPFWFVAGGAALAGSFVVFMVFIDVPMYVRRWLRSRRHAHPRLTLQEGLVDAQRRRIVTTEWAIWRPETAWLTGYFSVAVWISMSFVYLALA